MWQRIRDFASSDTHRTFGLLALIFAVATAVVLTIEIAAAPRDGIAFEVAKAGIQVAGVAVAGAIVAIITFNYQERHRQLVRDREIELDKFHRELERQADERRR